jgi:hypothetical protein
MDDKPIAHVLSYYPKMINNMHYPCSNEHKIILVRRSQAILEARKQGGKDALAVSQSEPEEASHLHQRLNCQQQAVRHH